MSWHKGASKPEGNDFAIASDYLETWNDSDSITAIIAQKDLRQSQNGGITTQEHNIKVSRSTVNMQKIVGTELRLESTIL